MKPSLRDEALQTIKKVSYRSREHHDVHALSYGSMHCALVLPGIQYHISPIPAFQEVSCVLCFEQV